MTGRRLAVISEGYLYVPEEAEGPSAPILVGSQMWYCWLSAEHQRPFSFRNALGTFAVRRESHRQGDSWYAYRKREGKLHKAYLGKTEELTLARLNAAAARLAGQHRAPDDLASCTPEPESLPSQTAPAGPARGREQPLLLETSASEEAAATRPFSPATLPLQRTPLIGREHEVEAVGWRLRRAEGRLLTLTGPGGIGKTRLGLVVAAAVQDVFADGVCFVSLAPLSDPDLVVPTIASTLGLPEVGRRVPLDLLKTFLQTRHLLLLLDNFEHVLSAAPVLSDLLSTCPYLTLLVTSRAVLHISGEQEYTVPALALPDLEQLPGSEALAQYAAVALFLRRAQAVKSDFQLTTTNARVLAEICTRLDGLPLAIELAAARLKLLSPEALLARLGQRLAVLTQGPRDMPERQQTLRKTLQWSYDMLSAAEQQLFRWLAVFIDGCTLEAVEAVCQLLDEEAGNVLEGVSSLLDQSLLQQAQPEREEPRLLMLETLREYGLECLERSGEAEATRRAHATYYLRLAEEAEQRLLGSEQGGGSIGWSERMRTCGLPSTGVSNVKSGRWSCAWLVP